MSELEAVGDAVTGGIVARSVEPAAGEGDGHTRETICLNCRTELVGGYCHACGQHAHVHRTLGAFWHDLLHGVLHFEGKIWRTLPLLAWRPGELTRRYVEGQRASFVSPIALFLFSVFLMFAVVSLLGGPFHLATTEPAAKAELQRGYEEAMADGRREMEVLGAERQALVRAGRPTAPVDSKIADVRRAMDLQESIFRGMGAKRQSGAATSDEELADSMIRVEGVPSLGWLETAYRKAKQNPGLLIYKLQTNAYKFSWALIPISVPFLWLLFLHRRRYRRFGAYDHIVFVTYSIAFMTLGFVALTLLRPVGAGWLSGLLVLLVPPVHMYRQLRGAYELSRWSAAWRTAALLFFAMIAAMIFMALLLLMGVLG